MREAADLSFWERLIALPDARELIAGHLAALPEGALGCALNDRYVSCYWTEGPTADADSVAQIQMELSGLRAILRANFAASEDATDVLKD